MGRKSKFDSSFKTKVVLDALKKKETLSELAKKYGIAPKQITDWKKEFLEKSSIVFEDKFLCFLKPIINGTGFYYVEPQTRDNRRMDIIVTYAGEEFVIELKMWYGRKYEQNGKVQLAEYLTSKKKDKGYLVTFSFLKEKANQTEPEWVEQDGKQIYEAIIDVNVSE